MGISMRTRLVSEDAMFILRNEVADCAVSFDSCTGDDLLPAGRNQMASQRIVSDVAEGSGATEEKTQSAKMVGWFLRRNLPRCHLLLQTEVSEEALSVTAIVSPTWLDDTIQSPRLSSQEGRLSPYHYPRSFTEYLTDEHLELYRRTRGYKEWYFNTDFPCKDSSADTSHAFSELPPYRMKGFSSELLRCRPGVCYALCIA